MHSDQQIDLQWRDGDVPVSTQFDDPYFSLEDSLAETRHVFLAGNRLPERFRSRFRIAELGFGSGLNLLAALHLWRDSGQTGVLHYASFEAFPMPLDAMIRAQVGFEVLAAMVREFAPFWRRGLLDIDPSDLWFRLVIGDARQTVAGWSGVADACFLDGFSPKKILKCGKIICWWQWVNTARAKPLCQLIPQPVLFGVVWLRPVSLRHVRRDSIAKAI